MGKILFLFVFCAIVSMPIFVLAILLWGCNDGVYNIGVGNKGNKM